MRSPEDMRIIQIELTNACVHTCSNCSRMCGHHTHPFFMDWETFKRAVDSMEGYEGTVGMMGGEPTLHPEFERFAKYLASKYPPKGGDSNLIAPTDTFMRNLRLEERSRVNTYEEEAGTNERIKGPGLWSSLVSNYAKHYELIQDTFIYQCVNDHTESSFHQPVMVTRKDLGITDEDWYPMRDKCWMQMNWSASITPKGAFFCEIAAALDMLFDGPGGWPIEPGWWKRRQEDFGDQLNWCEWCGLALETRSRDANEGPDDASPSFIERLKKVNSPKLKKGLVRVYRQDETDDASLVLHNNYQQVDFNRLGSTNTSIYPKGFVLGILPGSDGCDLAEMDKSEKSATGQFDIVLRKNDDQPFGDFINQLNKISDGKNVLLLTQGTEVTGDFVSVMKRYAINPGTMHIRKNGEGSLRLLKHESENSGIVLYHPSAYVLRDYGFDRLRQIRDLDEFVSLWPEKKTVLFDDEMLDQTKLAKLVHIEPGLRYVVYGAGKLSEIAINVIKKAGGNVVCLSDSDSCKWGKEYLGLSIISPEELVNSRGSYDRIVVGSFRYYTDIRKTLSEMGIEDAIIDSPLVIDGGV